MEMLYCQNCKKHTGHKRAIGIGTLLGGIATLGVSLIAIPFYPLRCVICGSGRTTTNNSQPSIQDFVAERTSDPDNRIESLVKEGGVSKTGMAMINDISVTQVEEECLRLFREGKISQAQCERVLDRSITEPDINYVENLAFKECPYCAETIKAKAILCRYCGRDLPVIEV